MCESSSFFVMNNVFGKESARTLLNLVLPRLIADLQDGAEPAAADPDRAYGTALRAVVAALLSSNRHDGSFEQPCFFDYAQSHSPNWIRDHLGAPEPVEVGKLYEYARGLKLDPSGAKGPRIVPCSAGKRNQGLFYTPVPIVRYIVSKALGSLQLSRSEHLLDVRIMDPAVGTGLFLAEALEQLTFRSLSCAASGDRAVVRRIGELKRQARDLFRQSGIRREPTDRMAIGVHLVKNCLYGVDLDPIAVAISRAVLCAKAAEGLPRPRGIEPLIRVGNSLIGQDGNRSAGVSPIIPPSDEDFKHAEAYFGAGSLDRQTVAAWVTEKRALHWPAEYPEIFGRENAGFDVVIGNPPYEIVSVKESGIEDRRREQAYFRRTYRTCSGKINTYRLMLERALTVVRDGGALGFIVPATLLADSSAARLRRLILDESDILQAVIVPEKARAFKGVTQACLVIVARKGRRTSVLRIGMWQGKGDISDVTGVEIARQVIDRMDSRIPLLQSAEEKALLEALMACPPLRGESATRNAGSVHQGEINMTVHRRFLSSCPTSHPLARGEHVEPFRIAHPSSRSGRWDWMVEDFLDSTDVVRGRSAIRTGACASRDCYRGEAPWNGKRIALARVVNMGTKRRLKAALVQPGTFLGDMTNYIKDITVSHAYLLGLLNSRLLNWRIKLTSTNNYLSATEVEALPVPRVAEGTARVPRVAEMGEMLDLLAADPKSLSLAGAISVLKMVQARWEGCHHETVSMRLIELLTDRLSDLGHADLDLSSTELNVLDALVITLFRVESLAEVLTDEGHRS